MIDLESGAKGGDKSRQEIRDQLTQLAPIFTKQKFLLGDEFSMLDVAISPLLWRLEHYGIDLPKSAAPVMKYAERIFSRQGFIDHADAIREGHAPLTNPMPRLAPAVAHHYERLMTDSTKPYLIRAIYEWCVDQGSRPISPLSWMRTRACHRVTRAMARSSSTCRPMQPTSSTWRTT